MQTNRRNVIRSLAGGGLILPGLLSEILAAEDNPLAPKKPHFAPKAKRVIFMFMNGGVSHVDTFDPKPYLTQHHDQPVAKGKRFYKAADWGFKKYGQSGTEVSDLFPQIGGMMDDICLIRSMQNINNDHFGATIGLHGGSDTFKRPSIGSWVSYGLGAMNRDLPTYIVMTSRGGSGDAQPLYSRLWSSGFLPTQHSGVKFRNSGDPVYYLSNPDGIDRDMRRDMLDDLGALNRRRFDSLGDPEIQGRIAQYEMAFRMQSSVPELTDVSGEPEHVLKLYGPDVKKAGSFAANCLLARRLAERDVRFIQLFHMGWDHHSNLARDMPRQCRDTDHPTAGLITDLRQRGLLDETLIVWGGEFGRTIYAQSPEKNGGRDHHPRCFSYMLAGGGVKSGLVHGETDDYSYNIVRDPVHVHDLNATILHQLGIDHERLTFKFQGRQYRLTDVHGRVVREILA